MSEEIVPANKRLPHLWKKGVSGNPAGRPKGSKNAITLAKVAMESELRSQMKDRMAAVVEKAFELAIAGDPAMIRMLFEAHVSKTRASDDSDAPREKVNIVIGRLDDADRQVKVTGRVIEHVEGNL